MRVRKPRTLAAALSLAVASAPIQANASFSKKPLIEYKMGLSIPRSERQELADLMVSKKNFERVLMGFKRNIGEMVLVSLRINDRKNFVEFLDKMMKKDHNGGDRNTIVLDLNSMLSTGRSFTSADREHITVGIAISNISRLRRIAKTRGGPEFVSRTFLELLVAAPGKRNFLTEFKMWVLSDESTESLYIRLSNAIAR
jgi:hypothetical protein